jgi:arginyl-tRNA synthetase
LDEKDEEKKSFRIALVMSVKTILENSFKLLGIEAPELM